MASLTLSGPPQPQTTEAPDQGPPEPLVSLLPTPNDFIILALADLQSLPPYDRPFQRYLSLPSREINSAKTCSLTLNYLSRASLIYRPPVVGNGYLVRVDLRLYAPRREDLAEWLVLWEELAFDPTYSLLITKDTLNLAELRLSDLPKKKVKHPISRKIVVQEASWRVVEHKGIVHKGGDYIFPDDSGRILKDLAAGTYSADFKYKVPEIVEEQIDLIEEDIPAFSLDGVDVVRFNSRAVNQQALTQLQLLTNSQAPITDHSYFKSRVLTTIKDKGVFQQVWGGLYYDFRGVKKAKAVLGEKTKATDLDLFFENLGIGNIKGGLTQEKLFDGLRSDQRLAVFRSNITGKPRDVSMFFTPAGREGGAWGAITGDVQDGDVDIGDRAFANLLQPRRKAREAIFPTASGFPIFGLFNGDGARQDEVPPDIANDHTIPAPFTKRLQAGLGCIRCHGTDGSDGWKPLTNDVKRLLSGRLDNFGDLAAGRKSLDFDTINRLVGLYQGDFTKNLRRARDDLAESTLRATGPWKESQDQTEVVKLAANRLSDEYAVYQFESVDAQIALREMGFKVSKKYARQIYQLLLPPDLRADVGGFIAEDSRIAALGEGLSENRSDWALVQSFAAERIQKRLREQPDILRVLMEMR